MMTCEKIRPLLALYPAGDLSDVEGESIVGHTNICPACMSEVIDYKKLIGSARSLDPAPRMDATVRQRIARQAAASAKASGFWTSIAAVIAGQHRLRPAAAVAAALALTVVAAPLALRHADSRLASPEITKIDVVEAGGVVRLAWSNGAKGTYTVYKSDNPREFSPAEAHTVHGNVWTDEASDTARVVFYRIE